MLRDHALICAESCLPGPPDAPIIVKPTNVQLPRSNVPSIDVVLSKPNNTGVPLLFCLFAYSLVTSVVHIPLDRLSSASCLSLYVLSLKNDRIHVLPSFLCMSYRLLVSLLVLAGVFLCAFLLCLSSLKLTADDHQVSWLMIIRFCMKL